MCHTKKENKLHQPLTNDWYLQKKHSNIYGIRQLCEHQHRQLCMTNKLKHLQQKWETGNVMACILIGIYKNLIFHLFEIKTHSVLAQIRVHTKKSCDCRPNILTHTINNALSIPPDRRSITCQSQAKYRKNIYRAQYWQLRGGWIRDATENVFEVNQYMFNHNSWTTFQS